MTASDFLVDAAIMSLLLFVAQYLRAHIKLLQKSLLPCSVIAGLIGLILGPQFVDILPFSDSVSSYSGVLIVVLFSSLFIGSESKGSFKKTMSEAGDTFLLNSAVYFGQYAFALLIGGVFMALVFPQVNVGFSLLMPGGFIGGHGTAATFGSAFEELCGWDEALTLGQTFATIGILSGVIFGAMCINVATKKGATRFITKASELPEGMRTGLVPPHEQGSIGRATVNPMSIDPLAWHLALVLIAAGSGYLVTKWLNSLIPGVSIPTFSVGMLCGVVLQFILKGLKLTTYDRLSGRFRRSIHPGFRSHQICNPLVGSLNHRPNFRIWLPAGDQPEVVPQLLVRAWYLHLWLVYRRNRHWRHLTESS